MVSDAAGSCTAPAHRLWLWHLARCLARALAHLPVCSRPAGHREQLRVQVQLDLGEPELQLLRPHLADQQRPHVRGAGAARAAGSAGAGRRGAQVLPPCSPARPRSRCDAPWPATCPSAAARWPTLSSAPTAFPAPARPACFPAQVGSGGREQQPGQPEQQTGGEVQIKGAVRNRAGCFRNTS
jgi:hypothetical protein